MGLGEEVVLDNVANFGIDVIWHKLYFAVESANLDIMSLPRGGCSICIAVRGGSHGVLRGKSRWSIVSPA